MILSKAEQKGLRSPRNRYETRQRGKQNLESDCIVSVQPCHWSLRQLQPFSEHKIPKKRSLINRARSSINCGKASRFQSWASPGIKCRTKKPGSRVRIHSSNSLLPFQDLLVGLRCRRMRRSSSGPYRCTQRHTVVKRAPTSAKISGVAGIVAPFLTAALLVQVAESPHVSTP
jgi:hypothetical protein